MRRLDSSAGKTQECSIGLLFWGHWLKSGRYKGSFPFSFFLLFLLRMNNSCLYCLSKLPSSAFFAIPHLEDAM